MAQALPGAAAFDSDIEATPLLQTGETYQDIIYENEIFQNESSLPWELLPLVLFLGVNDTDEPYFGLCLAYASKVLPTQIEHVTKHMVVQLDKYLFTGRKKKSAEVFPFNIVAFFHRTNPVIDDSFTIFQHFLSVLPKGHRKKISQIIVLGGGYSVKADLQFCRASKHFWASKFWTTDTYESIQSSIRGSTLLPLSRPPFCVFQDDMAAHKKTVSPFAFPVREQCALFGHYSRGCHKVPSTLTHLCFLLEEPRTLRTPNLLHTFASSETVYALAGDMESGTPSLPDTPPGALMAGLRITLASMSPLFGDGTYEQFQKEMRKKDGKMSKEFLTQICSSINPANKEVVKFLMLFFKVLLTCHRENGCNPKALGECFTWAFVKFTSLSEDSVAVSQFVALHIEELVTNWKAYEQIFGDFKEGAVKESYKADEEEEDDGYEYVYEDDNVVGAPEGLPTKGKAGEEDDGYEYVYEEEGGEDDGDEYEYEYVEE
eukprot:Blabericola_migrator_1__726@NODE_1181_length_5200_cov_79_295928_g803_i0_p2_GENE_NODE_1181_length_5200_cov_79_295928_g803_i0NODE_1181_length_5200_cov_79_295928_g803_i0_p2_ORF_typecomplete_len488_score124_98RhoGAP/PF00620_27/3_6e06DUF1708/PF08101_11/0_17_NODE_1181_length_5200_cov_79_295928_g803_i027024165